MMNILILGNGFDLAHGLPTRYTDFLSISKLLVSKADSDNNDYSILSNKLLQGINEYGLYDEFKYLLNNNIWFDFLSMRFERGRLIGINWIDFETEIRQVVCRFEQSKKQDDGTLVLSFNTAFQDDNDIYNLLEVGVDKIKTQSNTSLEYLDETNPAGTVFSYQEYLLFSEYLYQQLRDLTRAFEIYCVCLINKINDEFYNENAMIETDKQIRKLTTMVDSCKKELSAKQQQYATDKIRVDKLWENVQAYEKSGIYNSRSTRSNTPRPEWAKLSTELSCLQSEIEKIYSRIKNYSEELNELQAQYVEWRIFREVQIDGLLSFNYTNTFFSQYGTPNTKYCYIHGAAQCDPKNTNMVFGIDETLSSQEANTNFVFSKFKKYFQRIFYKTGAEYKDWFRDLKGPVNIYIVGHSLGTTDHEILREFFDLTDKKINGKSLAKVSVFYYNEESKINAIERTIEIIGKDRLVAKVHGNDSTIRFVNQNDPKDGLILAKSNITTCSLAHCV